jgi:methyltransferase (TIGR00027 family)
MKGDRASATALLVASGIAFHSTHPRHRELVPSEAGQLSRRFVAAAGRVRSGSSRTDRFLVALQEALTVPGLSLHYVLRKRAIEAAVRGAVAEGFRTLVVLGAGLDTLALRLAGEIRAVEIDHPATQRLKRDVAGETKVAFHPVDFTHRASAGFLPELEPRAVFVAEAVFLYLAEEDVRKVLAHIRERSPRARLIFTFWAPREGKSPNFRNARPLADFYLWLKREPGRWAIEPERLAVFLADNSFVLRQLLLDDDFHGPYKPLARGEHIAVCDALPR